MTVISCGECGDISHQINCNLSLDWCFVCEVIVERGDDCIAMISGRAECVLYWCVVSLCVVTSVLTTTRFCSSLVPAHSTTRQGVTMVETHLGLVLPVLAPVCLVTEQGVLVAVLTVLPSTVLYPVTHQYQYTDPIIQISCYCQCSYAPCQLRKCPLCYSFSTISTSCRSNPHTPSTTCCSAKLSTPNPTFSALKLGVPSVQVKYRLELFSSSGQQVQSTEHMVHVGQHASTVQYNMPGQGKLVMHLVRHQVRDMKAGWVVAKEEGQLVQTVVNNPTGYNTLLPGWLKVQDGEPVPPSPLLIQRGIHIATDKCREQVFSADLAGLEMVTGGVEDVHLVWDGNRRGKGSSPNK